MFWGDVQGRCLGKMARKVVRKRCPGRMLKRFKITAKQFTVFVLVWRCKSPYEMFTSQRCLRKPVLWSHISSLYQNCRNLTASRSKLRLPFTVQLSLKFDQQTPPKQAKTQNKPQNDTPIRTTGGRLNSRPNSCLNSPLKSRLIFCDWEFQTLNKVSISGGRTSKFQSLKQVSVHTEFQWSF